MTKLVLLFALTAACTSPTVSAGTEITGADAADAADAADTCADVPDAVDSAVDAALADALPDVPPAETAADAAPEVGADTAADVPSTCAALLGKISALKPKLAACSKGSSCKTFEHPICDSFGCFQTPVSATADTSELEQLAAQASSAQCEGFHCGCGTSTPSYCLNGACQQCPPNCDGSCEDVTAAVASAAHAANWCGSDKDCTILSTGTCPIGDLPCGGWYVSQYTKSGQFDALLGAYNKACGPSTCKCAISSTVSCVGGKCVGK